MIVVAYHAGMLVSIHAGFLKYEASIIHPAPEAGGARVAGASSTLYSWSNPRNCKVMAGNVKFRSLRCCGQGSPTSNFMALVRLTVRTSPCFVIFSSLSSTFMWLTAPTYPVYISSTKSMPAWLSDMPPIQTNLLPPGKFVHQT